MESPIGTIREIIVLFGYNNESFTYRALDYYADVRCHVQFCIAVVSRKLTPPSFCLFRIA